MFVNILADTGQPWLLTSPEVERFYLPLASLYRQQVKEMLKMFSRLENMCDSRYTKSLKLLKLVGFTIDEPEPYGKYGNPFCKFWIKT